MTGRYIIQCALQVTLSTKVANMSLWSWIGQWKDIRQPWPSRVDLGLGMGLIITQTFKVLLRSNFRIPFICGWLVVYVLKYMISKLYPHKMKESAIFLRSNSTNFHPPLNRHVPAARLPKADGVQWQQRPGHPGKTSDVRLSTRSPGKPYEANFSYGFEHVFEKCFVLSMVGSRCVVQWYNNCSNRAAGIALHASPADRTRDVWVQFVVLHVLLFSRFSSRDTWTFHPSQWTQIKPDLLKRVSDQEIVNLKKISEREGAAKGKLM